MVLTPLDLVVTRSGVCVARERRPHRVIRSLPIEQMRIHPQRRRRVLMAEHVRHGDYVEPRTDELRRSRVSQVMERQVLRELRLVPCRLEPAAAYSAVSERRADV
jgi:hypothetical protein